MGGDCIILDEAAHIDPKLFYEGILPMLQMSQTILLALSSPEGGQNYYSKLLTQLDVTTNPPIPLFRVLEFTMVCEPCRKLSAEDQLKCTHVPQPTRWLSKRKVERFKPVYASQPELGLRELAGVVIDTRKPCFSSESIAAFFSAPSVGLTGKPDTVYVSADPSGGGPSQLAVVSGYFDATGTFLILGLDCEPVVNHDEIKGLLRRHFKALDDIYVLRGVRKVFIPENNLGCEATHMHSMVRKLDSVETFWEKNKKPGVNKTYDISDTYQQVLGRRLEHRAIGFSTSLFTTGHRRSLDNIKLQLREQMETYYAEYDAEKHKVYFSGKSGHSKQDDLIIALMMVLHWGRVAESDPGRVHK